MRIIEIEGVGAETAKRLNTIGIRKTEDIKDWREVANIRQIGVGTVAKILNAANIQVFIWEIEEYRKNTRDISKTELIQIQKTRPTVIRVPKADVNDEKDSAWEYDSGEMRVIVDELNDYWSQGEDKDGETIISVFDSDTLERKLKIKLPKLERIDLEEIFETAFGEDVIVDIDGFYIACDSCGAYVDTQIHTYGYSENYLMGDGSILCEICGMDAKPKLYALAQFLEKEVPKGQDCDDIEESTYDEDEFSADGGEYLVLTDNEADDKAREYIEDSVWAFNTNFIAYHVEGNVDSIVEGYEETRNDWYEAIRIVGEMQDLNDQIDGWKDDLDDDDLDDDERDDIQEEIDAAEVELEDLKKELDETDFDEDVDEEDYSWEDDFFEDLAKMGIAGEAASSILMEGGSVESAIEEMQKSCESANDDLISMIDDMDTFVDDAISADGRGHFIAFYDFEENEAEIDGETYYIYRTN